MDLTVGWVSMNVKDELTKEKNMYTIRLPFEVNEVKKKKKIPGFQECLH